MKVFRIVRRQYTIVGIHPSNQSIPHHAFCKSSLIFFGFLLYGCVIPLQFVYIFHVANGLMEYVLCICSTSANIIMFVCFAAIVHRENTLFKCFDNIEKLIDTRCKYPQSKAFFMKTNRQVERLSKIVFMVMMKIILQCLMLPKFFVSFCIYFITESRSDSFELPYPMWFPFNTNNPIGYLIAVILEYIILGYGYFISACTLSLGIGAFWFAISATKDIQRGLHLIDDKTRSNEMKIVFSELIYAHGIVKQVEHDFSDIFQPIIVSIFIWSLLTISGALLFIQVEIMHHGNITGMLLMVLSGILGLALAFIACELCQRMNDEFEEIDFTFEQLNWYLFPNELKRMLPMVMTIAQQPVSLECFGSITCTRETFKNILHHAYSYFMILRQLNH